MPQKRNLTSLHLERAGILPQSAKLSQASKPEIKERLLKKQEEAKGEPNPEKNDDDATGTTLEEQTGGSMGRRKASYLDDEKTNSIPERSSCDDEPKEKAYERRRGSHRDSESSKKVSDKRKRTIP